MDIRYKFVTKTDIGYEFDSFFFMFSRIVFHLVTRPCTTSREKGQIHKKKKAIEGHEWYCKDLCAYFYVLV